MSKTKDEKNPNPLYEKWDEVWEYIFDEKSPILKMENEGFLSIKTMVPFITIELDEEKLDNEEY